MKTLSLLVLLALLALFIPGLSLAEPDYFVEEPAAPKKTQKITKPEAKVREIPEKIQNGQDETNNILNWQTHGEDAALAYPPNPEYKDYKLKDNIVLQALNKVTARTSKLELKVGEKVKFGSLEIDGHLCWSAPNDESKEAIALLDIWELKPGERPVRSFKGWMYSTSPALSTLDHPVYDIVVLDCK